MFAVHRKHLHTCLARLFHDNLAGHDQNFLAGDGEVLACFNGGQCGLEAGSPHDGDQHHVRLRKLRQAAQAFLARFHLGAGKGARQLVDSVGGVTVTPDASFSGFTAGQPVTLTGQRTENYIRYRADSTEGNNQRMQRQKQVVLALVNKMLAQVKEDPASVLALYNDVRRNITTNINTAMMVYLAQQASGMHFSGDIVNVPGTSVMGAQKHAEYQVNPDALLEMVLDIFYEPVDG